jgi:hypothetical protein
MVKVEREVPWCTIILVIAALTCHCIVLYGNIETSAAFRTIGVSTGGWSSVGTGIAASLREELNVILDGVEVKLIDALNQTLWVQDYIDMMISIIGNETEVAGTEVVEAFKMQAKTDKTVKTALIQVAAGTAATPWDLLPTAILGGLNQTITTLLGKITDQLEVFMDKLTPALEKVGEMIIKFGDKIVQILESFSLTLDNVQKMLDQIMAQLNPTMDPEMKEIMMYDTFTLFDVSGTGTISVSDLEEVAMIYSISALQGTKPAELVEIYDTNKDRVLDWDEFGLLVDDPSIPGAMSTVLRAYATSLATVAGLVGNAVMRDDVAYSVTKYLELVCAKNRTKLEWVSDALGNASLPLEFTADVFKNIAMDSDNPDLLTTADVGQVLIDVMWEMHPHQVLAVLDLMSTVEFWESEGFNPTDQPIVIERVTAWITGAQRNSVSLLSVDDANYISQETLAAMPAMAAAIAKQNMQSHMKAKRAKQIAKHTARFSSSGAKYLLDNLLGGEAASTVDGATEAAMQAVTAGVEALPETKLFAKWLSWNASDTAATFQDQCFDYSSKSSEALDSFANMIQGMVKKITSFINMLEEYSTPEGIKQLREEVSGFAVNAGADIIKVVYDKLEDYVVAGVPALEEGVNDAIDTVSEKIAETVVDQVVDPISDALAGPIEKILADALGSEEAAATVSEALTDALSDLLGNMTEEVLEKQIADKLQEVIEQAITQAADVIGNTVDDYTTSSSLMQTSASLDKSGIAKAAIRKATLKKAGLKSLADVTGAFDQIASLLRSFVKLLPQSADVMSFAKEEVGQVAEVMDSIFDSFAMKGPAIFDSIGDMWTAIWVLYFMFLLPMSLGLLYYGFWASGYFGGPRALQGEPDVIENPTTLERLSNCCSACSFCMKTYHDTQLCFWSCIILFEIVCLLIFVISLVLCVVAALKSFMLAGCGQVYMLADETVCTETVSVIQNFLATFNIGEEMVPLDQVCTSNMLLTCDLIQNKMASSTIHTTIFSFLAAVFSFQMILESACLHTRARYRRMIDALKDEDDH